MIDEQTIQRIKDRARIEEVVADFVSLRRQGPRYVGLCPFHNDRHATNFSVYPPRNIYYCFACKARGGPIEFVMNHLNLTFPEAIKWLGVKYSIITEDMEDIDYKPVPQRPVPEQLPMLELPMSMVTSRQNLEGDKLVKWMKTINWDELSRKRLPQVLKDYHVGHSKQGMTIFWQIDNQGRVRTGKMIRYGADGHRIKEKGYNNDWIHAALFRDKKIPQFDESKQMMKQCLFGLHLLGRYRNEDTNQAICIVESEKTALLMAIAYGNNAKQVWMACGGLSLLNQERLEPLMKQHRRIVLYPDRDAIDKWREKAEALNYDRITIDTRAVTEWWKPEDGPKADIADVVIRCINSARTITIQQAEERYPMIKPFIDTLNLTPKNDEKQRLHTRRDEDPEMDASKT